MRQELYGVCVDNTFLSLLGGFEAPPNAEQFALGDLEDYPKCGKLVQNESDPSKSKARASCTPLIYILLDSFSLNLPHFG